MKPVNSYCARTMAATHAKAGTRQAGNGRHTYTQTFYQVDLIAPRLLQQLWHCLEIFFSFFFFFLVGVNLSVSVDLSEDCQIFHFNKIINVKTVSQLLFVVLLFYVCVGVAGGLFLTVSSFLFAYCSQRSFLLISESKTQRIRQKKKKKYGKDFFFSLMLHKSFLLALLVN